MTLKLSRPILFFLVCLAVSCGKAPSSSADPAANPAPGSGTTPPPSSSVGGKNTTVPLPAGFSECGTNFVQQVVTLVNGERAQGNVAALKSNSTLMSAARQRSIDMATNQVLSHSGWDTTLANFGYQGSSMGENIGLGYTTPDTMVGGWVNSPEHYANMMNGAYIETGVGCVVDQSGQYWWTQDFGTPLQQ